MVLQLIQVDVRSPHVVGTHEGWTTDGVLFCFTTASLSRMLVSANGSWRLRRGESGGWQEHGPNSPDWVQLERVRLAGQSGYQLDLRWGWQSVSLIAIPAPPPARLAPAPTPDPVPVVTQVPALPAPRSITSGRRRTPA